jgi:hypothetical protein
MAKDNNRTKDDMDAILKEYDLALDEHKIINAHIVHFQEANAKLYEFGLVALGAIVVAAAFVIQQKAYNLLLVLSIPFHVLIWLQARRGMISHYLSKYIISEIAPRIRNTINLQYGTGQKSTFVFWEEYITTISQKNIAYAFVVGMPEAGRTIYQISIAGALVIAYFLFKASNPQYVSTWLDTGLLVLNGVAFFVTILGIIAAVFFYRNTRKD